MTAITTTPSVREVLTRKQRHPAGVALHVALLAAMLLTLLVLFTLVGQVLIQGIPMFTNRKFSFITDTIGSEPTKIGVWPGLYGSFWIGLGVIVFSFPIGIAAAIYLEEYAAAVPSIVYGILGLAVFARALSLGQSVITAAATLALLVLPIIIIATREALRAVPRSIRDGSLALGATPWQTAYRQTLPAALPGIATGTILALSRAIGEAAPLLMIGAVAFITFNPDGMLSGFTTLPIQIFNWTKDPREEFQILAAATIVLLLLMLLAMNAVAIWIRNRTQRRW